MFSDNMRECRVTCDVEDVDSCYAYVEEARVLLGTKYGSPKNSSRPASARNHRQVISLTPDAADEMARALMLFAARSRATERGDTP